MRERFKTDERGVSEVIGAVLIFGLIVLLLAVFQTAAIPAANEEVEFDHSQSLQGDLVELHEAASQAAQTGDPVSSTVQLGTRYPSRLMFFNPSPPAGTVKTTEPGEFRIENVSASGPGASQYMDGTVEGLSVRGLTYQANYNEYSNPPTTKYEHGVLYNQHDEAQTLVNDGSVVAGNEVNFLFPAGEFRESANGPISIDARPTSASTNSVTIFSNESGPVTFELPSQMNDSLWIDALDETYLKDVTRDGDSVRIALHEDGVYSLRMAQVGVGDNPPEQEPTYLHPVGGEELTVPQGQQKIVDIEVRDQFNNPVAHENIDVEILNENGNVVTDSNVTSDEDGVAGVQFNAPTEPQQLILQSSLDRSDGFDADDPRDLEQTIWVTEFAGGIGPEPEIVGSVADMGCGQSNLGDIIDDPIGGLTDDSAGISFDWNASVDPNADTDLDNVEIRMIRQEDNQIVDSATYQAYGQSEASDTTGLLDAGNCGDYDIQIIAETTGSRTRSGTAEGVEPEGGGGGGGGCLIGLLC